MKFIDSLIPNKKNQLSAILSLILVVVAIPVVATLLQENQDIRQQAAACVQDCSARDGILRSCTPPESDGSSNDSGCLWAGRVESCNNQDYCCSAAGGTWALCPTAAPTRAATASPSATVAPSATRAPSVTQTPSITAAPTNTPCTTNDQCGAGSICYQPPMPACPTGNSCAQVMPPAYCLPTAGLSQDIDEDGVVNQADLTILMTNYGVSPLNNPRADLNGDGIVNAVDYAYLLDAFGQTN